MASEPTSRPPPPYFPEDTVVTMQSDHPRLINTVLATLTTQRTSLVEQLASIPCKDYAEYQGRYSRIEGLNIAISHIKEAQKKLG